MCCRLIFTVLCWTLLLIGCGAKRLQRHRNVIHADVKAKVTPLSQDRHHTDPKAAWLCEGCSVVQHNEAISGNHSWLIHNGRVAESYAYTDIHVESGGKYFYSAMVKINELVGSSLWHEITMSVSINYKSGAMTGPYTTEVAILPYLRPVLGWQILGGDFIVQDKEVENATIQVKADNTKLVFMIDNGTLSQLRDDPDWKDKANERIDKFRKNNITFNINISESLDPAKVTILVNLSKHDFPFGSAIHMPFFINSTSDASKSASVMLNVPPGSRRLTEMVEKYREFFLFLYEWGVFENAMKWQDMESSEGNVNFAVTDAGLEELSSLGIPVRGHCITWAGVQHNPQWLVPKNQSSVEANVERRMDYLLGRYHGRLRQWDVINEDQHGSFFEEKMKDPDYMFKLFNMAHKRDPDAHLFMNDYSIISSGTYTLGYIQSAKRMKENHVPIYGMGTQSHLMGAPDITLIQKRLELEATVGLPIWITELDLTETNITVRAQGYEDILRLYFSTPAIHGIVMWGYWDKAHWRPQAALVEGDDFHINEAGARVIRLYKQEWSTNTVLVPTSHHDVIDVRGFHGNYSVTAMYGGSVMSKGSFYLHPGVDLTVNININPPGQ